MASRAGRWRGWRAVGRSVVEGLAAMGAFHTGLPTPTMTWRADEEVERALWAQLPEVRRLLPAFDAAAFGRGDGPS